MNIDHDEDIQKRLKEFIKNKITVYNSIKKLLIELNATNDCILSACAKFLFEIAAIEDFSDTDFSSLLSLIHKEFLKHKKLLQDKKNEQS